MEKELAHKMKKGAKFFVASKKKIRGKKRRKDSSSASDGCQWHQDWHQTFFV